MWHGIEDSSNDPHPADAEDRTLPSTPSPAMPPSRSSIPPYEVSFDDHAGGGGSEFRYLERVMKFKADGARFPRTRHFGYWLLHNVFVHPLLGLFPNEKTVHLHELASAWLNHEDDSFLLARRMLRTPVPKVTKRGMWVLHNVLAHAAIGVLPCKATFELHDWTARLMDVPEWV